MALYQPEPVEISTRIRPGEWTEESLTQLLASYRAKIMEMGASASEVVEEVERNDDGAVKVSVAWVKPDMAEAEGYTEENAGNPDRRPL
jgi:hypothetical protein